MKRWLLIGLGVLVLPGLLVTLAGGVIRLANPELARRWDAEAAAAQAQRDSVGTAAAAQASTGEQANSEWHYTETGNGIVAGVQADSAVRMPGNILGSYVDLSLAQSGGVWLRVGKGGGVSCTFDEVRLRIDAGSLRTYSCQVSEYDRELVHLKAANDLAPALIGSDKLTVDFATIGERKIVEFDTAGLTPAQQWVAD